MSEATQEVLLLQAIKKSYNVGKATETEVLHGIDMQVAKSDFTALIGPSGSGKSTLLNLIGLLDTPTSGELFLLGKPTSKMDDAARTALRGQSIGFVFQFHHLIQAFTAIENVLMPLMLARGKPDKESLDRGKELLAEVGLEKFIDKKPNELSGGQQQRVAIARALITLPALLLAYVPTFNLDIISSSYVFSFFRRFNEKYGCAFLLVTHDPRLSDSCDRTLTLVDGLIIKE